MALVVFDRQGPGFALGNAGFDALLLQGIPESVGVISAVGLGPIAGQAHHFRQYAPEPISYAIDRYTAEVRRLYGVMDRRLAERDYLGGAYSIADIACVGWIVPHQKQGQNLAEFPHLKRWFEIVTARPAVVRGMAMGRQERERTDFANDRKAQAVLFGHGDVPHANDSSR